MLLLEALKSNKGAILLLFHLLYLTRRWHLEIMNFNFCHRQRTKKKKKKNFIWELVLNILFLNATFKLLEKRSSAVISPNQYFFHCRSIMCRKRICHGGVRGARRDETYQSGTQTSLETAGSSRRADARFNLSNTLSYIRAWCCCCCCRTFQPPPQLSGGKPRPFDFWPPEILLTPLKEKQVERCSSTADGSNLSFLNKFVHICRLMTSCLLVKSVTCKIKPKIEDRSKNSGGSRSPE